LSSGVDRKLISSIEEHRPQCLVLLANHFVQLAESPILWSVKQKPAAAAVTSIIPAASAVPLDCERKLRSQFPTLKSVPCVYGSSETGIFTSTDTNSHLGSLMPDTELKVISARPGLFYGLTTTCRSLCFQIVDMETRRNLGPGQEGEIYVRRAHMMLAYLNMPQETAGFFEDRHDGYARMGDLGLYNTDGRIYFRERIKEMIKYFLSLHLIYTF
jgi:acyl-CoA synthetase (AMP-forming)/AMP-acid ligase II